MPEFRYYCLDPNGKILWGEHIEEADLDTAVDSACAQCSERMSGKCEGIEVWQRTSKLYPPEEPAERHAPADASADCPLRASGGE
jgi:hypothetical protein